MLESDNPVLPAFLATDDYVPGAFRDLLSEAEGCQQKGFLTGGTACARRALDLLLTVAKTEGSTYEDRLQSLGDKHSIAKMLTSILVQCGGASARDNATLSVEVTSALHRHDEGGGLRAVRRRTRAHQPAAVCEQPRHVSRAQACGRERREPVHRQRRARRNGRKSDERLQRHVGFSLRPQQIVPARANHGCVKPIVARIRPRRMKSPGARRKGP